MDDWRKEDKGRKVTEMCRSQNRGENGGIQLPEDQAKINIGEIIGMFKLAASRSGSRSRYSPP